MSWLCQNNVVEWCVDYIKQGKLGKMILSAAEKWYTKFIWNLFSNFLYESFALCLSVSVVNDVVSKTFFVNISHLHNWLTIYSHLWQQSQQLVKAFISWLSNLCRILLTCLGKRIKLQEETSKMTADSFYMNLHLV